MRKKFRCFKGLFLPLILFIPLTLFAAPAFSQSLTEAEIRTLISNINWEEVTFGFEAEARDEDTGKTDVEKMRLAVARNEGPILRGESKSYIESVSLEGTGNWEFQSIVMSRDKIFAAMRDIKNRLSKGDRSGVRGFHLHVRFPKAVLGNMPQHEFKALLSRFGDAAMGVRLRGYKPYFALSTSTVSRADAVIWNGDGDRAIMRYDEIGDHWDVEFRGFIRSLDEMEKTVDKFFVAIQNPKFRNGFYPLQVAVSSPRLAFIDALNHWASQNSKNIIDIENPTLNERMDLVWSTLFYNQAVVLPLIPFEIYPWLSDEKRQQLLEARKEFLQKSYELIVGNKPPKDRFRNLIKAWALQVDFERFTNDHLLMQKPQRGVWPDSAVTPALVKYLALGFSLLDLEQYQEEIYEEKVVKKSIKDLARQFNPEKLGEVARGIVTAEQANEIAGMLLKKKRQKFVDALAGHYATNCDALGPYLY